MPGAARRLDVGPRVCFFGHHHTRIDARIDGIPCVGLNKVRMAGNLVAIDLSGGRGSWSRLGEWPAAGSAEQEPSPGTPAPGI